MNMFDPEDQLAVRQELRGPSREQSIRFGCGCLSVLGVVVLLMSLLTPYTNYLWFAHDARQLSVFTIAYANRGLLFACAFIPAVLLLYFSISRALGVSLIYLRIPETLGEVILSNTLGWFRTRMGGLTKGVSIALAFFLALGFSGEWNTYLLAQHSVAFGKADPTFGLDLGFFVFRLPWYLAVANFALGLLFLTTAITIGIYVGMQMLASLAKIELGRPYVRMHASALIGATVLTYAVQMWLRRYEVGFSDSGQFTGAGFAGMQQLGAQTITAVLVALLAVAIVLNGRFWRPFRVAIVGGISCGAFYLLAVAIYPALIQRFRVEPDRINLESPYARKAIEMTRFGYALNRIEVKDAQVTEGPSAQDLKDAQTTIDNMRLWDPEVLRQTLEVIQTLKGYYIFNDVDVDRYTVGGKQTLTMLAARDISLGGLDPTSRSWVTERLQYTHGFGISMSPVNSADAEGLPTFIAKDIPPTSPPEIKLTEPRIYFSDFRNDRREPLDQYTLVNGNVPEFDYPSGEKMKSTRWTGDRGIPMSGLLPRLAFSAVFQDVNVLISGNITANTRLLVHRNVLERATLIYPFLKFDQDPYIVALNGRLIWLLDGYTTSGQIPYSSRIESINYIRNSVKVAIDAYTGEATAYAVEPDDPLLRAYRAIYPGLVRDKAEMPAGLDAHWRYPEDLFMIQSSVLQQYHVDEPVVFLNNSQAWELPYERGLSGDSEAMRAYYVQMRLPDEPKEGFLLILPFTPRQKINMSAWLAAHCDPGSYGRLVLYQYAEGTNIPGPAQMESTFNQDKVIADINRQLNNDQSKLVPGNLLVVPLGKSFMYVKPLFLQSRSVGIPPKPELKKVILALPRGKPVVADTYVEALEKLFGQAPEAQPAPQPTAPTSGSPLPVRGGVDRAQIRAAAKLLDQADAALRAGDFARYGDLLRQLKAKLQGLSQ